MRFSLFDAMKQCAVVFVCMVGTAGGQQTSGQQTPAPAATLPAYGTIGAGAQPGNDGGPLEREMAERLVKRRNADRQQ